MGDARIDGLLQRVERDKEERIGEVRRRAEARTQEIVRGARRDAARRVREAARKARELAQRRLQAKEAELLTRERERDREIASSLLERASRELTLELERRWRDEREPWIASLAALAAECLPREPWIVEHPPDLAREDLEQLLRSVVEEVELRAEPSLRAGLRIHAGGTTLDGSIGGLLARRDSVESRLLAELFRDAERT